MGGGVSCAGKPLLRSSAALTCILNERLSLRGSVGSVRSTNATVPTLFCLRGRLPPRTPGTNGSSEWPQPGPLEEHYATPQGVDEERRTIETGRAPPAPCWGWTGGGVDGRGHQTAGWAPSGRAHGRWSPTASRPGHAGGKCPPSLVVPPPKKPPLTTNTGCQRTTSCSLGIEMVKSNQKNPPKVSGRENGTITHPRSERIQNCTFNMFKEMKF